MLEEILKTIIVEKERQGIVRPVILNFLKEYLQFLVLSLIYNHSAYKKLVFKGGSCLRICFGLPRLSEDLDFDFTKKVMGESWLGELTEYLGEEIKGKYFPPLETKVQADRRLYLKFPLLRSLKMAKPPESEKLYVKIEADEGAATEAKFALTPISQFGFNFVAYHYDLPALMAGKIHALLHRLWFKGKKQEINIKGRDFYDLFWFFKNEVKPNWKMLKKITQVQNEKQLKAVLKERIKEVVTPQKLAYDLKNFIPDQGFVADFCQNYPEILEKYL